LQLQRLNGETCLRTIRKSSHVVIQITVMRFCRNI